MLGVADGERQSIGGIGAFGVGFGQKHLHHHGDLSFFGVACPDHRLLDEIGGVFGDIEPGQCGGHQRHAAGLPELALPLSHDPAEAAELHYQESGPADARVGWLRFEFLNGAMGTRQCQALSGALRELRRRPTRALVLLGGRDFFSNGIHLHEIEHAAQQPGDSAADASMTSNST